MEPPTAKDDAEVVEVELGNSSGDVGNESTSLNVDQSNVSAKTETTSDDLEEEPKGWGFSDPRLRPFVIISITYLLFTVTDGAIRMIVLLHAYNKSFSALQVAIMFTLYELAGVFTNLAAGMMGARWGIRFTLIVGLCLQIFSYGLLFGWKDEWSQRTAIIYVTIAQMFAGIAKDLTKLGGKTVTKLVTPEGRDTRLFRLVSLLTGWKNSLKGVGYFLGSALLEVSYDAALGFMIGLIVIAMPFAIFGLDKNLGTAKKKNSSLKEIFVLDNFNLNVLSLARLFLFASRDFWFEVPLPFYLRSPNCSALGPYFPCSPQDVDECTSGAVCDPTVEFCTNVNEGGGCGGTGLGRVVVGAFLGGYIILYGQVQSWTPQLVTNPLQQTPPNKMTEVFWGGFNCYPTLIAAIVVYASETFINYNLAGMITWLIVIIVSFAIIFAINSSIHSFLVVKYAKSDTVAKSVGFYYMSNAVGRLVGTLGSGFLYTYAGGQVETLGGYAAGNDARLGLAACFVAGTISSLLAAVITIWIKDEDAGLKCGRCLTIIAPKATSSQQQPQEVTETQRSALSA
jgi:MFS family permease